MLSICTSLAGCGGDDSDEMGFLGALEGEYDFRTFFQELDEDQEVNVDENCMLSVRGSKATGLCTLTPTDPTNDGEVVYDADFTIREESISGALNWTYELRHESDINTGCYTEEKGVVEIAGSATKSTGAVVDGIFAPLAGNWSGEVTLSITTDNTLVDGAEEFCNDVEEPLTLTFNATVMGSSATVLWTDGQGDGDTIIIEGTENRISVDGEGVNK